MKRIVLIMTIGLFTIGMSSCSIFKKCDCPKFNYLEDEVSPLEEEAVVFEVIENCTDPLEEIY
ncbi:MAG: hypothetical protein R3E32_17345 [Chitinophagales bacterium]